MIRGNTTSHSPISAIRQAKYETVGKSVNLDNKAQMCMPTHAVIRSTTNQVTILLRSANMTSQAIIRKYVMMITLNLC